jgi:hypothetical protein
VSCCVIEISSLCRFPLFSTRAVNAGLAIIWPCRFGS